MYVIINLYVLSEFQLKHVTQKADIFGAVEVTYAIAILEISGNFKRLFLFGIYDCLSACPMWL